MADSVWANNSEQVNMLAMITANDSPDARAAFVKALNQCNGDTEKVVDEYYSAGSFEAFASKYTYDPNAWGADRNGALPDLVVQGPDEHATWEHVNGNGLSAPSRPPSRNKSPLNQVTDWVMETSLGMNMDVPVNRRSEEEDLQRALQISKQESGIATGSNNFQGQQQPPAFGPATRDDHKEGEWGMVHASSARMDDPQPSARKREIGKPVFLRLRTQQQEDLHLLGPLIMVLHDIPAARNFVLKLQDAEDGPNYGSHSGWWRGEPISSPQSEAVALVYELQRLVAFLDGTQRSYGTADSLASSLRNLGGGTDFTVKFFESLYNSAHPEILPRLWNCVRSTSIDEESVQQFSMLDFRIRQDTPDYMRTLYNQWDLLFWINASSGTDPFGLDQEPTFAHIETAAEVITMRVTLEPGAKAIEIPDKLYIDRYLKKNSERARKMADQLSAMQQALGKLKDRITQLTQLTTKTGVSADRGLVLKRLIARSELNIRHVRTSSLWNTHEKQVLEATEANPPLSYLSDILAPLVYDDDQYPLNDRDEAEVKLLQTEIAELNRTLEHFQRRIARLDEQKEAIGRKLGVLNQTFTVPSEDEALNPTHKYTLRGVVCSHLTVFMCRRRKESAPSKDVEEQAEDVEEPAKDAEEPAKDVEEAAAPFKDVDDSASPDEWYKVWWDGDNNQVRQEATTFEMVHKNMFTEPDFVTNAARPLLVYATEQALNEAPIALSKELQTFVKHDNRLFKQEVIEQPDAPDQRDKKRVGFKTPQSPAKRQRSNSGDSMDSNRASLGDMSDGDRAQMMADQMMDNFGGSNGSGVDTEMRDMQPISEDQMANEIAAHMPPTPSLSADGSESPPIRRSTEQLASMSLGDFKAPEMEELQTPFIVRPPANAHGGLLDQSTDRVMSWPVIDEATAIPGGINPEEFYHPPN